MIVASNSFRKRVGFFYLTTSSANALAPASAGFSLITFTEFKVVGSLPSSG